MTDLLNCRGAASGAHYFLETGRRATQRSSLPTKLCLLWLQHNAGAFNPSLSTKGKHNVSAFNPTLSTEGKRNVGAFNPALSTQRTAHQRRLLVTAQSKEPGRKPKLSFGDQLLDYIEGGPKLRKWYGQEEAAPRDGGIEEEKDPLPKQTYSGPKDAVLVTDADSPTGQLVVLSLILARKRVRALVRDAKEAKASFGPYVEPIEGDVKDRESMERAMGEGVRAVIVTTRVGSVVDVARRAGVEHIVLLSQVGTSKQKDGGGLWGFKSLRGYLDDEASVAGGGVPYTIVRAGKLTDQPGGQTGISFGQGDTLRGTISREDAAAICVQALEIVPASALVFEAVSDNQTEPVEIGEAIKGLVGAEAVS